MGLNKLDRYLVLPSGEETLRKKINGNKLEVPYLSKDEYKELDDPQLIGYASLKRRRTDIEENAQKKQDEIVGLIEYHYTLLAVVRKKKHKFKTIKGYFDVGNNQYVAIEKNSLFLFLIPLLLALLIIGLCASCGGINNVDPDPEDPWQPVIEEDLGESSTKHSEQRSIEIFGFSSWHVPVGQTENIPITLKNSDGNPCYFSFVITLEETEEELYRSDMVTPGDTIRSIDINRPLEAGEYVASIKILTNELRTGNSMNDAVFEVALTVD